MQVVVGHISIAELKRMDAFLEFDSMINLRPGRGNRSRSVEDAATRSVIEGLVARVVVP